MSFPALILTVMDCFGTWALAREAHSPDGTPPLPFFSPQAPAKTASRRLSTWSSSTATSTASSRSMRAVTGSSSSSSSSEAGGESQNGGWAGWRQAWTWMYPCLLSRGSRRRLSATAGGVDPCWTVPDQGRPLTSEGAAPQCEMAAAAAVATTVNSSGTLIGGGRPQAVAAGGMTAAALSEGQGQGLALGRRRSGTARPNEGGSTGGTTTAWGHRRRAPASGTANAAAGWAREGPHPPIGTGARRRGLATAQTSLQAAPAPGRARRRLAGAAAPGSAAAATGVALGCWCRVPCSAWQLLVLPALLGACLPASLCIYLVVPQMSCLPAAGTVSVCAC